MRGAYYYDGAGRRLTLLYGNGSYSEYLYDAGGRLTALANRKSDHSDVSRFGYILDSAGMRRTMQISGSAFPSASIAYDYDGAYQLTRETRTGGSAYTQTFQYDSAGNRTRSVLGASTTTYEYDHIDRLTKRSAGSLEWDPWGNLTLHWGHTCEWDESNRLAEFDRSGSTEYDAEYACRPG